jgi:hydrogenase/urease accessory protein HupE
MHENITRKAIGLQGAARVFLALILLFPGWLAADVVKPALAELTLYQGGEYVFEIRTSLEALLAGINARYKNTRDAPTAAEYDQYRAMPPDELDEAFKGFRQTFLAEIDLRFDHDKARLEFREIEIPETGYKKVPRISIITLTGTVPPGTRSFSWRYPEKFGDTAFRYRHYNKDEYTWSEWLWLRNGESTGEMDIEADYVQRPFLDVVASYLKIGYLHIVPKGVDHILFILGIFLLSTRLRPLLWQVTAFTIAHTITLGLSMYGLIELSPRIIEPLIALSIAYVGLENLFLAKLHSARVVVVFLFGLLHGMGFAAFLGDFGMPRSDFVTALISFNVGVELGQLTLLLGAFVLLALPLQRTLNYRLLVVIPGSLLISVLGLVWTADRVLNG